jgi:predicted nucleic acid-binding protein
VAVAVFDSDVLIGFLDRDDDHHSRAVERVRLALAQGARRVVCAVNLAEVLVGPTRAGTLGVVDETLRRLGLDVVAVDRGLAEGAAAVRAHVGVRLPDAFALATSIFMEQTGAHDVRLETFDHALARADRELHPRGGGP